MSDSIVYNSLNSEESNDVVRFMAENFYPREPLSTGLHMTYEDNKEWIHYSVKDWVKGGVSVVARDKTTNQIVGTLLGTILTKNQSTSFDEALNSPKKKVKKLHAVLSALEESVNVFNKFSVNKILELTMITVSEEYSGKGIGKNLVQESEVRGKAIGCQLATSQATAVPSQRLLERLGYTSIYELNYSTFAIDGEPVFDMDRMLGTPSAKVMVHLLGPPMPPSSPHSRIFGWRGTRSFGFKRFRDKDCKNKIPQK